VRKEDIKRHLRTYSVYDKRSTTISHAFASAIAPTDQYNDDLLCGALRFLGQNPEDELTCVFCAAPAQTWDHLVGLVKAGELRGFGHQIGNLVPCCKGCNSEKGNKEFAVFINSSNRINGDKTELIRLLRSYQRRFAKEINLSELQRKLPNEYAEFQSVKQEIFELMKKADEIAKQLRDRIVE
jgi:hypothetical protein